MTRKTNLYISICIVLLAGGIGCGGKKKADGDGGPTTNDEAQKDGPLGDDIRATDKPDSKPNTGPSDELITAYCAAYVAFDKRCDQQIIGEFDCDVFRKEFSQYRAEALQALTSCSGTLPCDAPYSCFDHVMDQLYPDPSSDPSFNACIDQREACSKFGLPVYGVDLCAMFFFFGDELQGDFNTCLDSPCPETDNMCLIMSCPTITECMKAVGAHQM